MNQEYKISEEDLEKRLQEFSMREIVEAALKGHIPSHKSGYAILDFEENPAGELSFLSLGQNEYQPGEYLFLWSIDQNTELTPCSGDTSEKSFQEFCPYADEKNIMVCPYVAHPEEFSSDLTAEENCFLEENFFPGDDAEAWDFKIEEILKDFRYEKTQIENRDLQNSPENSFGAN